MKKLNQHSTKIFGKLLNKLNGREHIRLTVEEFMPLSFELLETNIKTPFGEAKMYSLMHYFIQNGDVMRDPDMTFLVIDNRQDPADYSALSIYPQSYRLDPLGIYEEGIRVNSNETMAYLFHYQTAHCAFANGWLQNIQEQGFLQ